MKHLVWIAILISNFSFAKEKNWWVYNPEAVLEEIQEFSESFENYVFYTEMTMDEMNLMIVLDSIDPNYLQNQFTYLDEQIKIFTGYFENRIKKFEKIKSKLNTNSPYSANEARLVADYFTYGQKMLEFIKDSFLAEDQFLRNQLTNNYQKKIESNFDMPYWYESGPDSLIGKMRKDYEENFPLMSAAYIMENGTFNNKLKLHKSLKSDYILGGLGDGRIPLMIRDYKTGKWGLIGTDYAYEKKYLAWFAECIYDTIYMDYNFYSADWIWLESVTAIGKKDGQNFVFEINRNDNEDAVELHKTTQTPYENVFFAPETYEYNGHVFIEKNGRYYLYDADLDKIVSDGFETFHYFPFKDYNIRTKN